MGSDVFVAKMKLEIRKYKEIQKSSVFYLENLKSLKNPAILIPADLRQLFLLPGQSKKCQNIQKSINMKSPPKSGCFDTSVASVALFVADERRGRRRKCLIWDLDFSSKKDDLIEARRALRNMRPKAKDFLLF